MALSKKAQAVLAAINNDEELLTWATYSIRYNTRATWGQDFMGKLHSHKIVFEGSDDVKAITQALSAIDKFDRNN